MNEVAVSFPATIKMYIATLISIATRLASVVEIPQEQINQYIKKHMRNDKTKYPIILIHIPFRLHLVRRISTK